MTICIATDAFPPHNSGISTHNAYLARLLQDAGHRIVVLTVDFNNLKGPDTIRNQEDITVVTLKDSYTESFNYFSRFIKSGNREAVVWLSLGTAMRKWLLGNNTTFQFDIIEFSDYGGFGLFLVDPDLPPAVVMCHSMLTQLSQHEFYNNDENLPVIRFLETNTIRYADAVICHSHSNAEEIEKTFNKKTYYAPAPWINDVVSPSPAYKNTFLVAGRLQVCKGALVMAATMQALQQQHPGINVVWIGDDTYTAPGGSMVSKFIRKTFPAAWQKNFMWKKGIPRKELLNHLDESEVIVIPSIWETFNYVALEAANRKKAMIITKQAGVSSLFTAGKEILLADADDIHSIAGAMVKLKKDKELTRSLGENAFAGLERNFNKEKFLSGRNEAYGMAMQHRKTNPPVNPLHPFFGGNN
ncbi:MAG: glycosyltransferase family 4 protein [Ferruginibacter sp.]|nr:glycosyltransferase family 4 protein [Chitinophagaceae bacterium]